MGLSQSRFCNFASTLFTREVVVMSSLMVAYAVSNVMYELSSEKDKNMRIIVTYQMFSGGVCTFLAYAFNKIFPGYFLAEGHTMRHTITCKAVLCIVGVALFGEALHQNVYMESMSRTSATYTSAMANIRPVFTLILALIFRLDNTELISFTGMGKVMGAMITFGGALLIIFYKVVVINNEKQESDHQHTLGMILGICCPVSYAISLIIQAKLLQIYNHPITTTSLIHFTAFIMCAAYTFYRENNLSQWIGGGFCMFGTSVISGFFSAMGMMLIGWCIQLKGPNFVSLFTPITTIVVSFVGPMWLHEKVYLGSILGIILILIANMSVLWVTRDETSETTDTTETLDQSGDIENPVQSIDVEATIMSYNWISANIKLIKLNNELFIIDRGLAE